MSCQGKKMNKSYKETNKIWKVELSRKRSHLEKSQMLKHEQAVSHKTASSDSFSQNIVL